MTNSSLKSTNAGPKGRRCRAPKIARGMPFCRSGSPRSSAGQSSRRGGLPTFGRPYLDIERSYSHSSRNGESSYRQGNSRPVRPSPRRPKLPVVGPDLQIPFTSAEDRQTPIGPIRFVIRILHEPVEHLEPHACLECDRDWLHVQVVQEGAKPLPLVLMWKVKARLRQHRIAQEKVPGRERFEVSCRQAVLCIPSIAERDERRRVDENHGRLCMSLRRTAWRAARRSWTS